MTSKAAIIANLMSENAVLKEQIGILLSDFRSIRNQTHEEDFSNYLARRAINRVVGWQKEMGNDLAV